MARRRVCVAALILAAAAAELKGPHAGGVADRAHHGESCDFIHVTNGDNIYHVDFFRHQLAVFSTRPDVGSTAVDFFCHLLKRYQRVAFGIAQIDLGCMLARPSAMRNMTFAVGLFEDGKPQPSKRRLWAADGFFAAELARRAPAVPIHDHGPLFFHL